MSDPTIYVVGSVSCILYLQGANFQEDVHIYSFKVPPDQLEKAHNALVHVRNRSEHTKIITYLLGRFVKPQGIHNQGKDLFEAAGSSAVQDQTAKASFITSIYICKFLLLSHNII